MVIPKGVPSSSLRAYLRPIETPDESTFEKTPALRNLAAVDRVNGIHRGTKVVPRTYFPDKWVEGIL